MPREVDSAGGVFRICTLLNMQQRRELNMQQRREFVESVLSQSVLSMAHVLKGHARAKHNLDM